MTSPLSRILVTREDGSQWYMYQAQREVLELLANTPLTVAELAELRGGYVPSTSTTLIALEREGFVYRKGTSRQRHKGTVAYPQLWHWTGKAFPRLPHSVEMSERLCNALAYSTQCETRLALLAKYEKGETA